MDNMLHGEYFYNYDKIRISSHIISKERGRGEQAKDSCHYTLCYVESCNACITDGKRKIFPKNNFVLLRDRRSAGWMECDEEVKYTMIDFKAELFGHMVRDYSDFSEMVKFLFNSSNFKKLNKNDVFLIEDTDGKLKELFNDSWLEYKTRKYKWGEVVKNNIYKIILEFVRTLDDNEVQHVGTDLVQSIVDYLEFNYVAKITQRDIAEKFNCSESYLTKLFKREFGMSLAEYLRQRRIFRSIDLLKQNYKISEISKMTGYENVDVFTKNFKFYVGMAPSEYRKKQKKLKPWYDDMKDLKEQMKLMKE